MGKERETKGDERVESEWERGTKKLMRTERAEEKMKVRIERRRRK